MADPSEWPDPGTDRTRRTDRWRGVAGVSLVAVVVGVFLRAPAVVLAAAVGVAVAGYARLASPPVPSLTLAREVADRGVDPGEPAAVTLTVRNDGDRMADLRVVDGVPGSAVVTDGSPACRTTLGPGETTTVEYAAETDRGAAGFRPALVVARDAAGVVERTTRVEAGGDAAVECAPAFDPVENVPLRAETARDAGRQTTDDAGSGVAFQVVREHQPGDPRSRIAWRHWARTDELATVDYQPERAATVLLVVDTRPAARVAPGPTEPTAVQRSVDAAARLFASLDEGGNRVGIVTLDDDRRWLPSGRGRTHRARAHDLLTDDALLAGEGEAFDPVGSADWLADRAPGAAQAIVLSPCCDDAIERFLVRLDALGLPVTVCSPDPTAADTPGRQLAGLERDQRLARLGRAGPATVDWGRDQSLERALLSGRRSA